MNRAITAGIIGIGLAALTGCSVFRSEDNTPPPDYSNITVMMREGGDLKAVIAKAAALRGWSVCDTGEDSLRLTISQRANLVEVNAIVVDESHYSLKPVTYNIPTRKYVQWIDNLTRTITSLAI